MTPDIESMDGMVQLVLHAEARQRILRQFPLLSAHRLPAAEDDLPTYSLAPAHTSPASEGTSAPPSSEQRLEGVAAALFGAADAASADLAKDLGGVGPGEQEEVVRAALRKFVPDLLSEYAAALSAEARSIRDRHSSSDLVGPEGVRYTNCLIGAPTVLADARSLHSALEAG